MLRTVYNIEFTPEDLDIVTHALGSQLDEIDEQGPDSSWLSPEQQDRARKILDFLVSMRQP